MDRSEWPASPGATVPKQEAINAQVPAGWHDGENEQRDVLVWLLEHPAIAGGVDESQEELE
jgi:hypothetical protein